MHCIGEPSESLRLFASSEGARDDAFASWLLRAVEAAVASATSDVGGDAGAAVDVAPALMADLATTRRLVVTGGVSKALVAALLGLYHESPSTWLGLMNHLADESDGESAAFRRFRDETCLVALAHCVADAPDALGMAHVRDAVLAAARDEHAASSLEDGALERRKAKTRLTAGGQEETARVASALADVLPLPIARNLARRCCASVRCHVLGSASAGTQQLPLTLFWLPTPRDAADAESTALALVRSAELQRVSLLVLPMAGAAMPAAAAEAVMLALQSLTNSGGAALESLRAFAVSMPTECPPLPGGFAFSQTPLLVSSSDDGLVSLALQLTRTTAGVATGMVLWGAQPSDVFFATSLPDTPTARTVLSTSNISDVLRLASGGAPMQTEAAAAAAASSSDQAAAALSPAVFTMEHIADDDDASDGGGKWVPVVVPLEPELLAIG